MQDRTAQRAIGTFLKSRRQLIVDLMKLSNALEGDLHSPAEVLLERFCQRMVDYLSNGYFRVYRDVLSPHTWTTPREYAIFDATTETAIAFNDCYAGGGHFEITAVRRELAGLALALETRFELEDDMLNRVPEVAAEAL